METKWNELVDAAGRAVAVDGFWLRESAKFMGVIEALAQDELALASLFRQAGTKQPHFAAFVAGALAEQSDELAALFGVEEATLEAWSNALDAVVIEQTRSTETMTFTHKSGWRLELDRDQVIPDNPGEGTPALVISPCGRRTGTWYCAVDVGEVDGEAISASLMAWLDGFACLIETLIQSVEVRQIEREVSA